MTSLYRCTSCPASWLPRHETEVLEHSLKGHVVVLEVQPEVDEPVYLPAPVEPARGPMDYLDRFVEDADEGDPGARARVSDAFRDPEDCDGLGRQGRWGAA